MPTNLFVAMASAREDDVSDSRHRMLSIAYASLHAVAAGWLFITGVSAVFAHPTRTGGICLAVNLVAAIAYVLLAYNRLILGVSSTKASVVRTALRSVDWLCTFPAMQVEVLLLLGVHPKGNTLEFVLVPVLAGLVISIDTALRFALGEVRNGPMLWLVGQLVAAILFVVLLVVLVGATPTVTQDDRSTTLFFVFLWCAYPAVSFFSDAVRWRTEFDIELVEDVLITLLDVVSKGGLATYIAMRN